MCMRPKLSYLRSESRVQCYRYLFHFAVHFVIRKRPVGALKNDAERDALFSAKRFVFIFVDQIDIFDKFKIHTLNFAE